MIADGWVECGQARHGEEEVHVKEAFVTPSALQVDS